MAKLLKLRRGTTAQHSSFTGAEGECTVDMTKDTLVVHDGSTAGGHVLLREDMSNLPAGTIDNADVNASAAIAGTKINPSFGSQTISTSGNIVANNGNLQGGELDVGTADTSSGHINAKEAMTFNIDSDNDDTDRSFKWYKNGSNGSGTQLLALDENGTLTASGNVDCNAGLDVTGDITATGDVTTTNLNANDITLTDAHPTITFTDSDNDPDFRIKGNSGTIEFEDITNNRASLTIYNDNHIDVHGNLDVGAGIDVTGAVNATTDIKTTGGKYYLDTGFYIGEVSSAGGSAESPDGSTEIVNGQVGKDLNLRAFGDIVFTSSNNSTANTVAKFQMPVLGASKHGVAYLHYVTANAGGNASSSKKLETKSTGVGITGSLDLSNDLNCSGNIYGPNNIGRDTGDKITWVDNTQLDVYVNGNNEFRFEADGDFHADGDIVAFSSTTASDSRLKSDIHTINDALGIVGKLRGVSYKWLRDGKADIGVIAQEVEEVVPEVVKTKTSLGLDGPEEIKTVDYGKLVGVLINAINELKAELDEHKKGGK